MSGIRKSIYRKVPRADGDAELLFYFHILGEFYHFIVIQVLELILSDFELKY